MRLKQSGTKGGSFLLGMLVGDACEWEAAGGGGRGVSLKRKLLFRGEKRGKILKLKY